MVQCVLEDIAAHPAVTKGGGLTLKCDDGELSVLRDVFVVSSPLIEDMLSTGSTSIKVSGSTKDDWLLVISQLYPILPHPVLSLQQVQQMLPVVHKYNFPVILQYMSSRLATELPSTWSLNPTAPNYIIKWLVMAEQLQQDALKKAALEGLKTQAFLQIRTQMETKALDADLLRLSPELTLEQAGTQLPSSWSLDPTAPGYIIKWLVTAEQLQLDALKQAALEGLKKQPATHPPTSQPLTMKRTKKRLSKAKSAQLYALNKSPRAGYLHCPNNIKAAACTAQATNRDLQAEVHTCKEAMKTVDVHDLQQHMGQLRAEVRRKEDATAAAQRSAKAERQITDATHKVGRVVINVGDHACQQRLAAAHALALGGHDYGHTTVEEASKMTGKQLQSYLQFHKQEVHTSWRVPKLLSHVCTHIREKLAAAAPPQQQLTPAGTTPELAEPAGAPPQQQQQLAAASTSRKRGAPAANKSRAAKQGATHNSVAKRASAARLACGEIA
ncbi:hypothetical protein QJQ45_013340 [Haematococcus lacustris]|nr:hypothetical protein QJQ45_013340 [Haematococcus lacustris]